MLADANAFEISDIQEDEGEAALAGRLDVTMLHWVENDWIEFSLSTVRGVEKTPEAARMAFAMGRENGDWLCAARPPAGSRGDSKWQVWQDFAVPKSWLSRLESGGREGIRTPGLLVANEEKSKIRCGTTIT